MPSSNKCFAMQLTGRGKTPEEREKILRKLSGIKEAPKKKEKKGATDCGKRSCCRGREAHRGQRCGG